MLTPLILISAMMAPQSYPANPAGFSVWKKGVPPSGLDQKDSFGNHTLAISRRDKDGLVEVHDAFADVIVVQSGKATLVVGGKVVEPKSIGPGETRGKSILNGVTRTIAAGDVIHIPAGLPHQFFIAPGEEIQYVLVKIAAR
jgi:mannose-6-phosphate isomerase-like protein (cupin superfamily)